MRPLLGLPVHGGLLLVELLLRSLPPRAATRLADAAGDLWYRLDGRRRARARESLRVARRGGLAVGDEEALARASFRQLMRVPVEAFVATRYVPSSRALVRRSRFRGAWRRLDRENRSGRGGIVVAGHLGSWEVAAAALRWLPVPAPVVVRPIANAWVDRRAVAARGGPEAVIPKRGAVRTMLRRLRTGGWVGLLADQDAGRRGRFVPFFGLPASTYAAPAVLAVRAGVPLYVGAALRRPGRPFTYEMRLARLPDPPAGLAEAQAVRHLLAAWLAVLEGWVAEHPEQYNWIHRRWKSRPAGEAPHAGLPAYARPAPSPASARDR